MEQYIIYFVLILMGVIVGEVLLQSSVHMSRKWMHNRTGLVACAEHSVIFTACLYGVFWAFGAVDFPNFPFIFSILGAHFVLEYMSAGVYWARVLKMEQNPLVEYYHVQLAKAVGHSDYSQEDFVKFVRENPVLCITEGLLGSCVFFFIELYVTTFVTHLLVMYGVVCLLRINGYL